MTNPTIILLDASALKESACIRRTYLGIVQGYKSKVNTNDIEYGSAYHKFVESLYQTDHNFAVSLKAALDYYANTPHIVKDKKHWLTAEHLTKTCVKHYNTFYDGTTLLDKFKVSSGPDGKPLVELQFSYPYASVSGIEVALCGTIDRVGKFEHGCYGIGDYKTTSAYDIPDYFRSYRLSPQLMFYALAIHDYAKRYPNSVYAEMVRVGFGCFIDGVFLSSSKPTAFIRSEVLMFSVDELNAFSDMLRDYVYNKLIPSIIANRIRKEGILNGACQTPFGKCKYFDVCAAPDSVAEEHILTHQFKQQQYNPLEFRL